MKKIIIILTVLATFGLGSCTDWLDLKPENETVLENYWQTESQASSVLTACYKDLTSYGCMERMMVWGELRSDNIVSGDLIFIDMLKILDISITPTNSYTDWSSFYTVINNCNTFLHFAPSVVNKDKNFTATKLHTMEAEALTIRALCYFYLVRAYKEVPLITTPTISDADNYNVGKSSEREVLDQIIKDLLEARKYARTQYDVAAQNKGRVTLTTVNALLADVYLWDQQYENCANTCDLVLADKTLLLSRGEKMQTEVFFTGNSTESIFELQFDRNFQFNNAVRNLYGYDKNEKSEWCYSQYLLTGSFSPFNYQPNTLNESSKDIRMSNFMDVFQKGSGYKINKYVLISSIENTSGIWIPTYRNSSTTANWIVYRLSDVMLMKAEALVQLNRDNSYLKTALDLVNTTYLRSNMTADSLKLNSYSDKSAMQELVLRERRRELMFEGKRWFDLMRVARRSNNPTSILQYISPNLHGDNLQIKRMSVMDALYMPINQSQIDINSLLKQNSFYENSDLSSSN